MHIAYFTNTYLPVTSGVVRSVSAYRKALTELGHNVFVFAQEDNYEDQEPFIFRYPSLPLPTSVDIPAVIPFSPIIAWLIPQLKLDIIHTHHPVILGQTAARKAKELNLPLVFTYHTNYQDYTHYFPLPQDTVQEFIKEAIHDWLQKFMQKCQHVIVPSQSTLNFLSEKYGLESRFTVIPTGIDLTPYLQNDKEALRKQFGWGNDPVMISVGRLAKEKNWELFLQSSARALQIHPRLKVVLAGDGPERKSLEKLTSDLGIRDRTHFLGNIPFDEIPLYLKAADFFGYASTTETQGLVILEAIAAGLPVVAVDASGVNDIVQNGEQGILVNEDPEDFAQAVNQILVNPDLYDKLRKAAYARSQKFEIKALAPQLLEVYAQAIQDKNAGKCVEVGNLEGSK